MVHYVPPLSRRELLRAIRWGQWFIDNLYLGNGTYGFMKGWSALPLSIYDPSSGKAYPAGYGEDPPHWHLSYSTINTEYADGFSWRGWVDITDGARTNGYYHNVSLYCKWYVQNKQVVAEIKIDTYKNWWVGRKDNLQLWFNCKPLSYDIKSDVGKTFTVYSSLGTGFPSLRYANRITMWPAYFHYTYSSEHPNWSERAEGIYNWLYQWGYFDKNVSYVPHYYAPIYGLTDNWRDDFWGDPKMFYDDDTWAHEPVHYCRYPYWSKVFLGGDTTRRMYQEGSIYTLAQNQPHFKAMRVIHLLRKYQDLDAKEDTPFEFTARELLFYGGGVNWMDTDWVITPLISDYVIGKGVPHPRLPESMMPLYTACVLIAMCMAGYGFGFEECKCIADDLAWVLVHSQWGTPFDDKMPPLGHEWKITDPALIPEAWANTVEYGWLQRPDQIGGWSQYCIWDEPFGTPAHTYRKDWIEELADYWGMPPESAIDSYVGFEPTYICVRALEIYDWYKYRRTGRIFPRLTIPEDVNGDGVVDYKDLLLIREVIESGDYCVVADLNCDGVVDMQDYEMVKRALRVPIKGVLWWPAISETEEVTVT